MKHNYKFSYILSLSILGLYINELYAAPVTDDEQVAKPQEENIKEPEKKSKDKPGKKEEFKTIDAFLKDKEFNSNGGR